MSGFNDAAALIPSKLSYQPAKCNGPSNPRTTPREFRTEKLRSRHAYLFSVLVFLAPLFWIPELVRPNLEGIEIPKHIEFERHTSSAFSEHPHHESV